MIFTNGQNHCSEYEIVLRSGRAVRSGEVGFLWITEGWQYGGTGVVNDIIVAMQFLSSAKYGGVCVGWIRDGSGVLVAVKEFIPVGAIESLRRLLPDSPALGR